MKNMHIKSLLRSPVKTIVTLLLIAAAAFMFLYSFAEYDTTHREYVDTRDNYQGVLTVEEAEVPELVDARYNSFLLSDKTNPGKTYDRFLYEEYHHADLSDGIIVELSSLPYISRVDKRYMTSGLSPDYLRMDNDYNYFYYAGRCIFVATYRGAERDLPFLANQLPKVEECVKLKIGNIDVLAGNPEWLYSKDEHTISLELLFEDIQDQYAFQASGSSSYRFVMMSTFTGLHPSTVDALEVGHRYIFVLRCEPTYGINYSFYMGDDARVNWWPYIYDVTDLDEGWLETDEFAPLRELIKVTNDDLYTYDVVYTDDMTSIRRVANERIMLMDGRYITPEDAGQPVCVVSAAYLKNNGLAVGDKITLALGDKLYEQYAPLGAVASTKGRYPDSFTEQEFTIIGSYHDLNDGKHISRDYYWCYSDNTVFVPTSFLPDAVDISDHGFKPAEMSFVVEDAENIVPFIEECIPKLDAMGINYEFEDGGWPAISEQLKQAEELALSKLFIFTAAAVFAILIAVWLFIGRKKKDYATLRALGMKKGGAAASLLVPLTILGTVAVIIGGTASITSSVNANITMMMLGALAFLVLLIVCAGIGVFIISRKSILALLQNGGK